MNKKAIVLFSGGLDSMLAVKLMLEQGIDVMALHFSSIFCDSKSKKDRKHVKKAAIDLNVPLTDIDITREFMDIVKAPRYGRGGNMNPCIDCRIFSFKKAGGFMRETGASFIVTGEVVGERPMSQTKHAIDLIEKKSGLDGLIVRPLSAKLLTPSIPETSGIIDREKLLDIQGRSRKIQFSLAKKFGIEDYPNPAGGCLLTDKGFSNRLKDLLRRDSGCGADDLELLKIARHFRINETSRLLVGRDQKENERLLLLAKPGDYVFDIIGIPSPIALARGNINKEELSLAASIMARYSDVKSDSVNVSYSIFPSKDNRSITVNPASEQTISPLRI
ncbi:MAG: 7-cyano-7-deazaguanine synthase [Candidatus Omnitrophica bacterium]|nr:7-cyano-7-deazaguanine synthase [Candidatus Omnitrophota bacterium]